MLNVTGFTYPFNRGTGAVGSYFIDWLGAFCPCKWIGGIATSDFLSSSSYPIHWCVWVVVGDCAG